MRRPFVGPMKRTLAKTVVVGYEGQDPLAQVEPLRSNWHGLTRGEPGDFTRSQFG